MAGEIRSGGNGEKYCLEYCTNEWMISDSAPAIKFTNHELRFRC